MEYNKIDTYLGNKLFEARVVKRITQEELSDKISSKYKQLSGKKKGISRQMYAFYEKGVYSMPIDVFRIACDILGLKWKEIFNDALDSCKETI